MSALRWVLIADASVVVVMGASLAATYVRAGKRSTEDGRIRRRHLAGRA